MLNKIRLKNINIIGIRQYNNTQKKNSLETKTNNSQKTLKSNTQISTLDTLLVTTNYIIFLSRETSSS